MGRRPEPDLLKLGREFDHEAKAEYVRDLKDARPAESNKVLRTAGTTVLGPDGSIDVPMTLLGYGFTDILLTIPGENGEPDWNVIIEIKNTDWDSRADRRVRPNLLRHARQVWGYMEPLVAAADRGEIGTPQGALLYRRRPRRPDRAEQVENVIGERFLSLVYYEEL